VHAALFEQGAVPRIAAPRIGPVQTADGTELQADVSLENEPGFLFDALVLPDGEAAVNALLRDGHTCEFIRDQYRHCKSILALGTGLQLLQAAGVGSATPTEVPDPGIVIADDADSGAAAFIEAVARHRHFQRETDPPMV
jgi:catalase